jgi:hypothetical protein
VSDYRDKQTAKTKTKTKSQAFQRGDYTAHQLKDLEPEQTATS